MSFLKRVRVVAGEFKNSPWGVPENITKIDEGIFWIDTPSHGGIAIKKERAKKLLPKEALDTFVGDWGTGNWVWYEEDVDALIPLALIKGLFDKAKIKTGLSGDKDKIDQALIKNHKKLARYVDDKGM